MTNLTQLLILSLACAAPLTGAALPVDSTAANLAAHTTDNRRLLSTTWVNPVMKAHEGDASLSEVRGEFNWRGDGSDAVVNPQVGSAERTWAFDAATYIKHRTSTLWGHASYHNGKTMDVRWNETSDLATVYPYVLADSIGGDLKLERYNFEGGWTDTFGRWDIGASMGYTAGLYYRNVDPRPRNITARLEAAVGAGYHINEDMLVAATIGFEKYKQTNGVEFYSDLGSRRLVHLTGLASHYARFAGNGLSTSYKGYTWLGGVNLDWKERLWISATASHVTIDNMLNDLSRITIARVTHNEIDAEAAYFVSPTMAVVARGEIARRVGRENVFGDPVSGVYSEITHHDRYFNNIATASLQAQYTLPLNNFTLQVVPQVAFDHRNQYYNATRNREYTNRLAGGAQVKGLWQLGTTLLSAQFTAVYSDCVDDMWDVIISDQEMQPVAAIEQRRHDLAAASQLYTQARLAATFALPRTRLLVRPSLDWQRVAYTAPYHTNSILATLGVVF